MSNAPTVVKSDLALWSSKLALTPEYLFAYASGAATSPASLLSLIDFRERLKESGYSGSTVPCDVFVLGEGEPQERDVTKVGGLPYRPASAAWPIAPDGTPYVFAFQFRVTESHDILPQIPGDVLLFFMKDPYIELGDDSFVHIEWQPLGLTDLVVPEKCLGEKWPYFYGYGIRYRSLDFVDQEAVSKEYVRQWKLLGIEETGGEYTNHLIALGATRYGGPKIGGLPPWFQRARNSSPDEQFLCSLGTFYPPDEMLYPWANREQPFSSQESGKEGNSLDWYDGFELLFFLDKDKNVKWYLDLPSSLE